MARKLEGKKVAILVTDGFEQVEMTKPRQALDEAGGLGGLGVPLEAAAYAVSVASYFLVIPLFLAAAGPQLRIVANHAVGFDNVDVAAATARGVAVRPRGVRTMNCSRSRYGSISSLSVSAGRFIVAASASTPVGPPPTTPTSVSR